MTGVRKPVETHSRRLGAKISACGFPPSPSALGKLGTNRQAFHIPTAPSGLRFLLNTTARLRRAPERSPAWAVHQSWPLGSFFDWKMLLTCGTCPGGQDRESPVILPAG